MYSGSSNGLSKHPCRMPVSSLKGTDGRSLIHTEATYEWKMVLCSLHSRRQAQLLVEEESLVFIEDYLQIEIEEYLTLNFT